MPGLIDSTEISYGSTNQYPPTGLRLSLQTWPNPPMRALLAGRTPHPGIYMPEVYVAHEGGIGGRAPVGMQRSRAERGWVPNADEPEPALREFFSQPQQSGLNSRTNNSRIPSPASNATQSQYIEYVGEAIQIEVEHSLASELDNLVLPGDLRGGIEPTGAGPQLWSVHGYYLSAEESEESEESDVSGESDGSVESNESDGPVGQRDESGRWAATLPDGLDADIPALSHATQLLWLSNATRGGEFDPVENPQMWRRLLSTISTPAGELEVSEFAISVDGPQRETLPGSVPIIAQTVQEVSSTLQSNEDVPAALEAMEMLAVHAIEHVYYNVNDWFQLNESVPNHFDLQKDYIGLMLNVLRYRDGFWRKAAAGCLQTQGIFWLAWILEGGNQYLPLIQPLQNEECLPPIIDELADLMGGYY